MICNLTEASLHLGYRARSTLQRLVRDGQLAPYRVPSSGRQILLETDPSGLPSLRETVQALTQYRPGSPLWQRHRPTTDPFDELSDDALGAYTDRVMAGLDALSSPDWEAISCHGNTMLDCAAWSSPPWSADQWATLAMVMALAQDAAADA